MYEYTCMLTWSNIKFMHICLGAVYYGRVKCTFEHGICDDWMTVRGEIVNTSTHNFTASQRYMQNGRYTYVVTATL